MDKKYELIHQFVANHFGHSDFSIELFDEARSGVYRVQTNHEHSPSGCIAKLTSAEEVEALKLISNAGISGVPELLGSQISADQAFILIPEYPGRPLDWSDAVPKSVLQCLAQVHYSFRDTKPNLPCTNKDTLALVFDYALGDLDIYHSPKVRTKLAYVRSALDEFTATDEMSNTLVNWDVHPMNIITDEHESVLIDWGLARMGPAMIDLANMVKWDSPEFHKYTEAWEAVSEEPFNYDTARIEYNWSVAMTQIKYLRFAAVKLKKPENVERMAQVAFAHAQKLKGIAGY
jgi:Ser/Thr protein kinase RdoA (MazF antagonist)